VAALTSQAFDQSNTPMFAYKCQWRKRSSVVSEFASGAIKQNLIDAIIALNATGAFSRWTIIVHGLPTASDSITTSSS
jgi:hypothetical protein